MKTKLLLLPALLMLLLTACGPNTKMTASWKDPEFVAGQRAQKVFVAALSPNLQVRQSLENALADEIISRGGKALRSYERFPMSRDQANLGSAEVLASIKEAGCDAILLVVMLDKKEETHYVEGSTTVYGGGGYGYGGYYGGGYGGYYGHYATVVTSPGYYETNKEYYLETSIFNALTEKAIWTGQSTTTNPSTIDAFIADYKYVLLNRLRKDGVLAPPAKK
jgi:hypothetical protein